MTISSKISTPLKFGTFLIIPSLIFATVYLIYKNHSAMYLGLICLIIYLYLAFKYFARFKKVGIKNSMLEVSNFRETQFISPENIINITETKWLRFHPITVEFDLPTAFGKSIIFMPKYIINRSIKESHPIVDELRKLKGGTYENP